MTTQLIAAIVTITLALCFYTVGVFSERRAHSLQKRHVILFWCGLVFDTTGTTIMSTMAHGSGLLSPHGITGALAIVLMLFHAVWATLVYARGNAEKQPCGVFRTAAFAVYGVRSISPACPGTCPAHRESARSSIPRC